MDVLKCKQITQVGKRCTRTGTKEGLCTQHFKMKKSSVPVKTIPIISKTDSIQKQQEFRLPSLKSNISASITRETKFEGDVNYMAAQILYLADTHSEHCVTIGDLDTYQKGHMLTWIVPKVRQMKIIKAPVENINLMGRQLTVNNLNTLMEWMSQLLFDAQEKKIYHPPNTIIEHKDPGILKFHLESGLNWLLNIIEDVVEALVYRSINISRIQLLAIASFSYYLKIYDAEYFSFMSDRIYTPEEVENEIKWFANFKLTRIKKFKDSDFDYKASEVHLLIKDTFPDMLRSCMDKRFVLIPLLWNFHDTLVHESAHENMLIYDKTTNTIERYEPHGTDNEILDITLKVYFRTKFNIDYIAPSAFCPIGIQTLQESELKKGNVKGKIKGFCQAWSFWYADLRLSNPHLDRKQVIDLGIQRLKERPETLTEYIIQYTAYYDEFIK